MHRLSQGEVFDWENAILSRGRGVALPDKSWGFAFVPGEGVHASRNLRDLTLGGKRGRWTRKVKGKKRNLLLGGLMLA